MRGIDRQNEGSSKSVILEIGASLHLLSGRKESPAPLVVVPMKFSILVLQLDHGALDGADRIRQCIGDKI